MLKTFAKLIKNNEGASAAEYALIVAVLGGLVVAGATFFGNSLNNTMTNSGKALEAESSTSFK